MKNSQTKSKAESPEEQAGEGLAAVPCSPASNTPETDAYIGEQNEDLMTPGEIAMCEFARRMERQRNEYRAIFVACHPLHFHEWRDGSWVVDAEAGQYQLESCQCGAVREKAGTQTGLENDKSAGTDASEKKL